MGDKSVPDATIIPDTYSCPPGEYRIPHTEATACSKRTTITAFGRRYVGPHYDRYWFKGTPVAPGLRSTYPAFGQPAAKPVLFGVDEGSDGPVFWAQVQTSGAAKLCGASPAKVLRRLKVQLQVASGAQLSAPAMYGLGGGQHSVSAYLRKHCAPSLAFSRAEVMQELAALHQQSLHSQWCALKQADGGLHIHLSRDAHLLRLRLEDSQMYIDLMVRGAFQSLDLSLMGVPKQLSSQAGLREVLPLLEHAHRCAGASAACNGKYDSILLGDEHRPYVNQQGQVCGHEEMQTILTRDGLFTGTVRSTACSHLVPQGTLLCKPCKQLQRSHLDSRLRRAQNRQQAGQKSSRARPRTETYEETVKRADEAQAELRNQLRREARLRRKVAEMESGLQAIRKATNDMQSEFRVVGEATNDDLLQLFEAAQHMDNSTGASDADRSRRAPLWMSM